MIPPVGIVVKMILMFILHYNSLGHEMIMKMIVKIMKVTWPELVLRKNLRSNFAFASLAQYDTEDDHHHHNVDHHDDDYDDYDVDDHDDDYDEYVDDDHDDDYDDYADEDF